MNRRARPDPHHSALHAAARVALLGAGLGCGSAPTEGLSPRSTEAEPPPDGGVADATAVPEALDGGAVLVTDVGVVADAGLGAPDAGESCDRASLTPEEYLACCERLGWSWDRGCAAWGPPAPPSIEGVA